MRKSKPITVTLGKQQGSVDRRLASGLYDSASEVIRGIESGTTRTPRSSSRPRAEVSSKQESKEESNL